MDWVPELRLRPSPPNHAWQKQGTKCWLLNKNVLKNDKVFLKCQVSDSLSESAQVEVALEEDKVTAKVRVDRDSLFPKADTPSNALTDDLSKLAVNSSAEVFLFLSDRLSLHKPYFYCGTDLFFLKDSSVDSRTAQPDPKTKADQMQAAVDWLLDEDTFKTEFSNPFTFTTEVLKRYMWTLEQQSIVFCGEKQSGKTSNLWSVLETVCHFNLSSVAKDKLEGVRVRNQSWKARVSLLEQKIAKEEADSVKRISALLPPDSSGTRKQSANGRDTQQSGTTQGKQSKASAVGQKSSSGGFSLKQSIQSGSDLGKPVSRKAFNESLMRCSRVGLSLVQVYSGNGVLSNAGVLKLTLSVDEEYKFVGFAYSTHLLQSFRAVPPTGSSDQGNFAFLYAVVQGSSKEEMSQLMLGNEVHDHLMLSCSGLTAKDKESFGQVWRDVKEELTKEECQVVSAVVAVILKLGNMRRSLKESKTLMNEVHKLLQCRSSELFTYLMMDKKGFVLQNQEFVERVEALIEVLYGSLATHVLSLLGSKHSSVGQKSPPAKALHLVDMTGYEDVELQASQSRRKNGFGEMMANFFFEAFVDFFSTNRFERQGLYAREVVDVSVPVTAHRSNKPFLESLFAIERKLLKCPSPQEFKEALKGQLNVLDRQAFNRLVLRDKSPTTAPDDDVVAVEHSFSRFFNYSLKGLLHGNAFLHLKDIKRLMGGSQVLQRLPLFSPSFKKSRMSKQRLDHAELFQGLQDSCISFCYCLKVPPSNSPADRHRAVFGQLNSVDFESLIHHHKHDFPYKVGYRFFIERFNIRTKVAQIKPDLNVDFGQLVRSILGQAFGQSRPDLYAFGNTNLFVREGFYEQLNSLLKDSLPKSRLLVFVEKALKDVLATHVDNTKAVVAAAQRFLLTHCVQNRFQRILKSKERFVKVWRAWRVRKEAKAMAKETIDWVLHNMPYYNLKKVTKVQAIWRGRQVRLKLFKNEYRAIRALQVKHDVANRLGKLKTLALSLLDAQTVQQRIQRQRLAVGAVVAVCWVQRNKLLLSKTRKVIGMFFRKVRVRLALEQVRVSRFKRTRAARAIQRFMKSIRIKTARFYEEVEQEHLDELAENDSRVAEFDRLLNNELKNASLPALPLTSTLPAKDDVGKVKASYSLQVLSVSLLEQPLKNPSTFAKAFAANLALAYKEDLLKLELTTDELLMTSLKQRVLLQKVNSNKCLEFRLPVKADRSSFVQDSFLYLEETGILKSRYLSFEVADISQFHIDEEEFEDDEDGQDESVFEFTKVGTFCTRNGSVAGATLCRKLFIQSQAFDSNDPPRVFQMKRPVAQVALGLDFCLFLDDSGVVYSIGENEFGQLGLGHRQKSFRIQMVKSLVDGKEIVKSVAVGENHCLALTSAGKVFGWGNNSWFQITLKSRNCRLWFQKPKDVTPELKPDINTKLQVHCGRHSSYVFTSNMKLLAMGRVAANRKAVGSEFQKVLPSVPKGVCVVGLDVKWNESVEVVVLKVVDYRFSSFDKISFMTSHNASLFEHFTRSGHGALLPFTDSFAKFLPLNALCSKLVGVKNKAESQKYDKMVENMMAMK